MRRRSTRTPPAASVEPAARDTPRDTPRRAAAARKQRIAPIWLFPLGEIAAFALSIVSAVASSVGILIVGVCISLLIVYWARARGDALVCALAVLVFWMPFNVTFTRFGISPQEIGLYVVIAACLVFSPHGPIRFVAGLFASLTVFARLALLVFTLACLQSIRQLQHADPILLFTSVRQLWLYPLLFALLVAYAVRTRNCLPVIIQAFVAGAVMFACYGLVLEFAHTDVAIGAVAGRLGSQASILTGYHPNNLGLYFALALVFMPAIVRQAWDAWELRRIKLASAAIAIFLLASALWLTYSRGALVAALIGTGTVILVWAFLGSFRSQLIGVGIIVLGVGGGGGLILWKGTAALGRYAGLLNVSSLSSDPNLRFRFALYMRALAQAQAHMFTGIGPGAFSQGAAVPFSPHNTYLDLWVAIGLFGVLAFVAAMLLGIVAAFRVAQRLRFAWRPRGLHTLDVLGIAGALVAFLLQAFVETFDQEPRIAPAIWILVGCAEGVLVAASAS
ncbi:MAG: O-antigen ligase family protein, partial [Ktedonobacterales bacterium]